MPSDHQVGNSWTKVVMGRYRIHGSRFLGQGSFSIVYAATDMQTGQEVAVKLYKVDTSAAASCYEQGHEPDLQAMYDEFRAKKACYQSGARNLRPELERLRSKIQAIETRQEILFKFKRQVKVLERIQDYGSALSQNPKTHPSASYRVNNLQATTRKHLDELDPDCLFVRMLDYSRDPSGEPGFVQEEQNTTACYIVLEMAMFTLKDYLKDRASKNAPMNIQDVHSIVCSMIHMVCVLHACQLCHLDIKPENIMMTEDKCWKLIDVDGCVASQESIAVDDPTISFTPLYAAPEFCRILVDGTIESLQISRCMDSWSVGMSCLDLVLLRPALESRYCDIVKRHDSSLPFFQWLSDESQPFVVDEFAADKQPKEKYDCLRDMLSKLLHKNVEMRWSIPQCLEHPFYKSFPLPAARRQQQAPSPASAVHCAPTTTVVENEEPFSQTTSQLFWEDGTAYGIDAHRSRILRNSVHSGSETTIAHLEKNMFSVSSGGKTQNVLETKTHKRRDTTRR